MSDITPDGLRADIATAFGEYMTQLIQAGPSWEKSPAAPADGDAGWSARQVAEHIGGAGGFFGGFIAKLIGATGPTASQPTDADAATAAAAAPAAHLSLMGVVDQVTPAQLGMETEFGPLGKTTLGNVIGVVAYHYRDHANQLTALRG